MFSSVLSGQCLSRQCFVRLEQVISNFLVVYLKGAVGNAAFDRVDTVHIDIGCRLGDPVEVLEFFSLAR